MSRPMSAFVPGQVISITIDDTTLNVMVRSVEIAGGPKTSTSATNTVSGGRGWVHALAGGDGQSGGAAGGPGRPYQPERVADTSTGGQPLEQIIERSRVDALERRADTRDTVLNEIQLAIAKVEASISDVFRQLVNARREDAHLHDRINTHTNRIEPLEATLAKVETVFANHNERLVKHRDRLGALETSRNDRLDALERIAETASRFFNLKPKE